MNSFAFIFWLNKDGGASVFWRPLSFKFTRNLNPFWSWSEVYDFNFRFVFCCYNRSMVASSVQKKLNKSCRSTHNVLCDLLLTVVQVSSTLINIKPTICALHMINMTYCGKSPLEWGKIESCYKILVFSRTPRRILLRISAMKDETLLIVIMKQFFIFIN